MNCEACLEWMLEAEPAELRAAASTTGDLAAHLARCTRCRAAAERVLAREDEMRAVWRAALPVRRLKVLVATGGRAASAEEVERAEGAATERGSRTGRRSGARSRRRRTAAWLVPLAAAAALGGVLALQWDDVSTRFGGDSLERTAAAMRLLYPPPTVPEAPVVNAAPGGGVAVLRTNDPRITLILNF
ncbi:MAG: hypothetical protein WEB88_01505 [Gemmatimonadota bacterium]